MSDRQPAAPEVAAEDGEAGSAIDEAASTSRPTPAFRRFSAARHAPREEPTPILPDVHGSGSADDGVVLPDPDPAAPPPPAAPAPSSSTPPPPLRSAPPPPVPDLPLASEADRVAEALRRLDEDGSFLLPVHDPQAELDASVGAGEWFDSGPASRAAPAAPVSAETNADPVRPPGRAPLLPPLRQPRAEFGGGDVGAGGDRLAAVLIYLLLMVGAPTLGLTLFAALYLAWRMIEHGPDDWKLSHYRYQYRTALITLVAGLAGGVLQFVDYAGVLAVPFLMLLVGWLTLRAAIGLHHLFQGRAHPNYRTWLI